MTKYSRSSNKVNDPYAFLALQVIHQALREIECYYKHEGKDDEIKSGYQALRWIKRMDGKFRLYASVTSLPVQEIHQLCLNKINEIRKEAYQRQRLAKQDQQSKVRGSTDTEVVSAEH